MKSKYNNMKRLAIIMILCLGCLIGLSAQNIWKPINVQGIYLGVGPDGSIYANHGWSGIARSQDEGETWQIVLGSETGYDYYSNSYSFSVSPEGRVFVIEDEPHRLFYSDDNGDTWHCTSNIPLINYTNVVKVKGLYAASNDVIVGWSEYLDVFWTTDGGDTWQTTCLDFLWMNYNDNCDLLVNENGDVFFSPGFMNGIYRSNLSDMEQWEIAAFEDYRINDMEFDPEGNVVGGVYLGESTPVFAQTPGFYAIKAEYLGIADNGAIFKWKRNGKKCIPSLLKTSPLILVLSPRLCISPCLFVCF